MSPRCSLTLALGLAIALGSPACSGTDDANGECAVDGDCGPGFTCTGQTCVISTGTGTGTSGTGTATGTGTTTDTAPCTDATWVNYGRDFFDTKCNSCHGAVFTTRTKAASARREIASGAMPPRSHALTASEKERVLKWIDCGTP